MTSTPVSTRRKWFIGSISLSALALIGVLAAEILVRTTSRWGYVTPESLAMQRPLYGPSVFARHVFPLREHRVLDGQGKLRYTINALGYRGPLFTPNKPERTVRIIFYGGSTVFDHDNSGNGDWPHRVERRLNDLNDSRVEVINAGIPGHATYDAVGRLYAEGHLFNPDFVVLYDQWNSIKDFRTTAPLLRNRLPISRSEFESPLFTYQNRLDRWLCNVSQIYVRLRERYYTGGLRIGSEGAVPEGEYVSTLTEASLRQYRMDVQTFADVARNAGAVPVFVTEAHLVAPDNTDAQKKRINYEMVLLTPDALNRAYQETDRILKDVAEQKQVQFIDASSAMSGADDFFLDAVHLTDRGVETLSEIVATALAPALSKYKGQSLTLAEPRRP